MSFIRAHYDDAKKKYLDRIEWSDRILYKMCAGEPRHADLGRVHGRLSLIGRGYATGLERLLKGNKEQSGNLNAWTDYFVRRAKTLDAIVQEVRRVRSPLTEDKLKRIAVLHGRFAGALQKHRRFRKTKKHKRKLTPTSFVSKYLHFHNPAVPIYDSWASAGACRHRLLGKGSDTLGVMPEGADPDYWHFLRRFWCVYQDARKELGRKTSVRHLDRYLLAVRKRK
jgi:hypothetical protein